MGRNLRSADQYGFTWHFKGLQFYHLPHFGISSSRPKNHFILSFWINLYSEFCLIELLQIIRVSLTKALLPNFECLFFNIDLPQLSGN